jgi:hypothetical protein
MKSVHELEAELKEARRREQAEADERRASVTPVYEYTIAPVGPRHNHDKVFTDTHKWYRLQGRITNKEEALAVGHSDHTLSEGGMNYLFNLTFPSHPEMVCTSGGGTIYLSDGSWAWGRQDNKEAMEVSFRKAVTAIEQFIALNPEGGDITHIITEHKKEIGR